MHMPPRVATRDQLEAVHSAAYVANFCDGALNAQSTRRIGFGEVTRTAPLIQRTKAEVAGTVLTADLALRHGLAVNTAGGTHHAFRDAGSGFCILNDIAVAAETLNAEGRCRRVLVVDLDVHQGDGTAAIFSGRPDVFTFSVHAANNFPARKEQSHLDIGLPDGTADEEYLR